MADNGGRYLITLVNRPASDKLRQSNTALSEFEQLSKPWTMNTLYFNLYSHFKKFHITIVPINSSQTISGEILFIIQWKLRELVNNIDFIIIFQRMNNKIYIIFYCILDYDIVALFELNISHVIFIIICLANLQFISVTTPEKDMKQSKKYKNFILGFCSKPALEYAQFLFHISCKHSKNIITRGQTIVVG